MRNITLAKKEEHFHADFVDKRSDPLSLSLKAAQYNCARVKTMIFQTVINREEEKVQKPKRRILHNDFRVHIAHELQSEMDQENGVRKKETEKGKNGI